jgi:hypothetical protein
VPCGSGSLSATVNLEGIGGDKKRSSSGSTSSTNIARNDDNAYMSPHLIQSLLVIVSIHLV